MASTEEYMASISPVAFPFTIHNYALCDGSLLSLSQNYALYALLGNYWGGDGKTTFALPNLQGRVMVGHGHQPGASQYDLGQVGGTETVNLLASNLPPHTHPVALGGSGTGDVAQVSAGVASPSGAMPVTAPAGGGEPVSIMQPYVTVNYQIAIAGMFPSRN